MPSDESVTQWLARLKVRDEDSLAQQQIYGRYIPQLLDFVRNRLRDAPRRVADEEDIANEALDSLFRGIRDARFAKLDGREDLWEVLRMLARRRVVDQLRRDLSLKRRVCGESVLDAGGDSSCSDGMQQVADQRHGPDSLVQMHEAFCRRLEQLAKPEYAQHRLPEIAQWKLEGKTNDEIAAALGCVTRTVERRLDLIRKIWASQSASPDQSQPST